ncbi:hypothetical protein [Neorhizobium galegae]|uniref:hypothetical protein n=1 Tax=Neorhizobium galegae TaxID=399 RepID=UPI001F46BA17|nr:hypothetical protein [Neorhizobium galegae]UIK07053.1 hypothetical protein LZK81_08855 [Neorhizobium galegae]
MTPITTFGFSAFMGMLFLRERPQRTSIKKRLSPSKKGGRDFHTSFRQGANELVAQGKPLHEIIASMQNIKLEAERTSAIKGIKRLASWKALQLYKPMKFSAATYESPASMFRVRFEPNLGLNLDGRHTAIHIWNNKADIVPALTLASLTLLKNAYATTRGGPDDWAILSVKDLKLYKHSEADERHLRLSEMLVEKLEKTFSNVRDELASSGKLIFPYDEDRPEDHF